MLIKSDKPTTIPNPADLFPPATFFQSRTMDSAVSWLSTMAAPFGSNASNQETGDL